MPNNNEIDLASLFTQVGKALSQQKSELNQADTQNHDHGDNMVEIFKLIAQAAKQKQSSSPAAQLDYAAQLVQKKPSGSAQMYAKGLEQAAKQFQGTQIDAGNILQLIQVLMGGGQAKPAPQAPAAGAGGLGDLLTQLAGGAASGSGSDSEIDASDLINAGLAYMNAKNQGASTGEALIKALVADSAMGSSAHRAQSSELVMKTLLDVVGRMAAK